MLTSQNNTVYLFFQVIKNRIYRSSACYFGTKPVIQDFKHVSSAKWKPIDSGVDFDLNGLHPGIYQKKFDLPLKYEQAVKYTQGSGKYVVVVFAPLKNMLMWYCTYFCPKLIN